MKDVQSAVDTRNIDIRMAGVKNVSYPISVRDRSRVRQHTVASVNMSVNLAKECRGTHMSRFVEVLNEYHGDFDTSCMPAVLQRTKERLGAETARVEFSFPYFIEDDRGRRWYQCTLAGCLDNEAQISLTLTVPLHFAAAVRSLDAEAVVDITFARFFWFEDIIARVEQGADAAVRAVAAGSEKNLTAELFCLFICSRLAPVTAFRCYTVAVHTRSQNCTSYASAGGGKPSVEPCGVCSSKKEQESL